ncbi:hypothetical protein RFI_05268 [Reticulomyxa filosa]|uniref:Uncharacterized protein n=1 Tax=Reticulomyxa filosa TaxID=46433 RepID=X6P0V7_RETFI|nr:hypothetical protein RFI_05268 [Reticulomyxa filosa]|eukprot:ETO31851.1 hypothetical protein RFI_05268 [Reticulomyxa filosa]
MFSSEVFVTIGSKKYTLHLTNLTFDDLKEQVVKASEEDERGKVLTKITDLNGHDIETDKQLQNTSPLHFYAYFQSNDQEKKETNPAEIQTETLDLKTHWNRNWRKANTEAVKIVMEMLKNDEQGLIVVANDTHAWQVAINESLQTSKDDEFSFHVLINNEILETKIFGEYCLYVITSKIILFNGITIDGNVYAVNCEIQCKGDNVNITTQLFVTSHAIISQSLTKSISPIQWNAKIHHDILVQIQDFEEQSERCAGQRKYVESIHYLQQALQIAIDIFGLKHPYIAIMYNLIGINYKDNRQYDEAVIYYKKAIKLVIDIFGNTSLHVGNTLFNLGHLYCNNKKQYDKAIKCYERSLQIRKDIFKIKDRFIGDSYSNLGLSFKQKGEVNSAHQYYEEAWKAYSVIFGEWNDETLRSKTHIKELE